MTDLYDLDLTEGRRDRSQLRITIYTESADDAAFFNGAIGPRLRRYIYFTEPDRKLRGRNNGYHAAILTCRKQRRNALKRDKPEEHYFCLLDGHVSAAFGAGMDIFDARSPVFSVDDPKADGVLFINCNEIENLYFLYSNAGRHIQNFYKKNDRIGEFWTVMARSLHYAGLNAACLYARGPKVVGFMPRTTYIREMKAPNADIAGLFKLAMRYRSKSFKWHPPLRYYAAKKKEDKRFREYWLGIKERIKKAHPSSIESDPFASEFLRLCDGKELLEPILAEPRAKWGPRFEREVMESEFVPLFQCALLRKLTSPRASRS